ncbi:hypothetical protein KIPB_013668, partial [Kipferlia bialata]
SDAELRKVAIQFTLYLLYRVDSLDLSMITSDQRIVQILAWEERRQSYKNFIATEATAKELENTLSTHSGVLDSLVTRVQQLESRVRDMDTRTEELE